MNECTLILFLLFLYWWADNDKKLYIQAKLMANPEANVVLSPRPSPNLGLKNCSGPETFGSRPTKVKEIPTAQVAPETQPNDGSGSNNASAPAPKYA